MDYAILEMTGNVVTEPKIEGDGNTLRTKFRVVANFGATPENGWEATREFAVDVICWRRLAQSAVGIRVGDPIILRGKMHRSCYEVDGHRRYRIECEAMALGHNLSAGTAKFNRWPKGDGWASRPAAAEEPAGPIDTPDPSSIPWAQHDADAAVQQPESETTPTFAPTGTEDEPPF